MSVEKLSEDINQGQENSYVQHLEAQRQNATETQKNVEKVQGAKYGSALLRIMERTKDNPEIVNNLNEFLAALEGQSLFGDEAEQLSVARQKDLAEFLEEMAKALRWTVGGGERPNDLKVNLKKWEQK